MAASPLDDRSAAQILSRAGLVSVGVAAPSGPHVTPERFAVAGGRIWVVTSCTSVKVRSIRRDPKVGVLVRSGERSLVLRGRAEVLGMWSASEAAHLLRQAPAALEAGIRYGARNVPSMLGYAADLCRLPAGSLPLDRVWVAIRPTSGLVARGEEIVKVWLGGRMRVLDASAPAAPDLLPELSAQLPDAVRRLLEADGDAAVGWAAPGGPAVLPGTWLASRGSAAVPAALIDALHLPAGAEACVVLDDSAALRPTQLRGLMIRGPGRMMPVGGRVAVQLRAQRVTWWQGFRTGTARASEAKAEPRSVAAAP